MPTQVFVWFACFLRVSRAEQKTLSAARLEVPRGLTLLQLEAFSDGV